jgi:hypothetical protein
VNIKDNKKSYYINQDEWETLIEEEVIEDAIADASLEVLNGKYTRSQLSEMVDRQHLVITATRFLALTYTYSPKELPAIMDNNLAQLAGGEDWINRRN